MPLRFSRQGSIDSAEQVVACGRGDYAFLRCYGSGVSSEPRRSPFSGLRVHKHPCPSPMRSDRQSTSCLARPTPVSRRCAFGNAKLCLCVCCVWGRSSVHPHTSARSRRTIQLDVAAAIDAMDPDVDNLDVDPRGPSPTRWLKRNRVHPAASASSDDANNSKNTTGNELQPLGSRKQASFLDPRG